MSVCPGCDRTVGHPVRYGHHTVPGVARIAPDAHAVADRATARFPGELFVQAQLTARFGFWEPSVGPELGLSGFAKLDPRLPFPSVQLYQQEDADVGPLYVALNASPLRFRFGMFLVNAMEFQVGTSAPPLGVTTRTYLGLLRLGVAL